MASRSKLDVADLVRWNDGMPSRKKLVKGRKIIAYVHPDAAARMRAGDAAFKLTGKLTRSSPHGNVTKGNKRRA